MKKLTVRCLTVLYVAFLLVITPFPLWPVFWVEWRIRKPEA